MSRPARHRNCAGWEPLHSGTQSLPPPRRQIRRTQLSGSPPESSLRRLRSQGFPVWLPLSFQRPRGRVETASLPAPRETSFAHRATLASVLVTPRSEGPGLSAPTAPNGQRRFLSCSEGPAPADRCPWVPKPLGISNCPLFAGKTLKLGKTEPRAAEAADAKGPAARVCRATWCWARGGAAGPRLPGRAGGGDGSARRSASLRPST